MSLCHGLLVLNGSKYIETKLLKKKRKKKNKKRRRRKKGNEKKKKKKKRGKKTSEYKMRIRIGFLNRGDKEERGCSERSCTAVWNKQE